MDVELVIVHHTRWTSLLGVAEAAALPHTVGGNHTVARTLSTCSVVTVSEAPVGINTEGFTSSTLSKLAEVVNDMPNIFEIVSVIVSPVLTGSSAEETRRCPPVPRSTNGEDVPGAVHDDFQL